MEQKHDIYDRYVAHGITGDDLLHRGFSVEQMWDQIDLEPGDERATVCKAVLGVALEDAIWLGGLGPSDAATYNIEGYGDNWSGIEIVPLQAEEGPSIAFRITGVGKDGLWQLGDPQDAANAAVDWYVAELTKQD